MSGYFPCSRFLCKTTPALLAAVVLSGWMQAGAQTYAVSTQHRDAERALPRTLVAGPKVLQARLRATGASITLVTVDVDGDGVADLLTGYVAGDAGALVLQRGNPKAVAPGKEEQALLRAGGSVTPFEESGTVLALPVRPDLMTSGDVRGVGHSDLFVAQRGDVTAYLLPGDGQGNFGMPQSVALAGGARAFATWRDAEGKLQLAASVCSATACGVQVLSSDGTEQRFIPTASSVVSLTAAQLQGGRPDDLLALTAEGVLLIDGDSIASDKPRTQLLPVASAVAMESGHFLYDKRTYRQIAVLDAAGTLHILAHEGLDRSVYSDAELHARREALSMQGATATMVSAGEMRSLPWTEVETLTGVAAGERVVMLRGRFSGVLDDLAVMSGSQFVTVSHAQVTEGGTRQSVPTVTSDSSSGVITGAVAVHANADSRQGIVTIGNAVQALYTVPPANRTMNVNTTADAKPSVASKALCTGGSAGCTLRSAIAVANDDAGSTGTSKVDTINVPAGTYTLSATNSGSTLDANGDLDYHLNIYGSVNIVGVGTATTLINGANLDKVFSINPNLNKTLNVYFSNLTIENGVEKNARGGYDYYGGLMDADLGGTGTLGFSSVTLTAGLSQSSEGGAMYLSNTAASAPAGLFEMDNCTISNNKSPYGGGAIYLPNYIPTILAGDTFSANIADPTAYAAAGTTTAIGGALQLVPVPSNGTTAPSIAITNSSFTSNSAKSGGGAIYLTNGGFTISGTTFSQNTATTSAYGGAIFMRNGAFPGSITTSTFLSNTAPLGGGAICVDGTSQSTYDVLTVKYSRFHSNGGTNAVLASCTSGFSTVTAIDNWWGCNGAATGAGCDVAAKLFSGTLTVSPYTTLTLQLNTTTPAYGATLTATASLGQDSASTVYAQANDAAYVGVPASLAITQKNGAVTQAAQSSLGAISSPSTLYAAITTSATADSLGAGTATATVDGTAVTANFTVQGADLTVTSAHTGDFKAGDTADTYTLTVTNGGSTATSGTVTVVDSVPFGFTVTGLSGSGWSCTVATATCTRTSALAAGSSYPAISVTVSVGALIRGVLTNSVTVSGGGEVITSNNTGTDNTNVIASPVLQMAFSPSIVGKSVNSTLTFTLTNYSDNPATLTNVSFTVTLPSGVTAPFALGTTNCSSGFIVANVTMVTFSGASVAAGTSCTASVNVQGTVVGQYSITSSLVTASNSNAGGAASATLNIVVVPTQLVFTTPPTTPITAGTPGVAANVALEDSTGAIASTDSSTPVMLTVSGPNSYSATYFATASAGVATFYGTQVPLTVSGSYTYTASVGGLTSAVATQKVTGGNAVSVSVTGLGTYMAPGHYDFATVTFRDQFGNVADGFTGFVYLTSSDPLAVFFPVSHFFTSVDAGMRTFVVTLNTAGLQSVSAVWGGVPGSQTGILVQDAVWLLNMNGTMVRADSGGTTTANAGSSSSPGALGFASDHSGSVWTVQNNSTTVSLYSAAGVLQSGFNGASAGVNAPTAVAIDGLGRSWIANGNGSVSVLSNAGAALSPATGLAPGTVSAPKAILIDHAGSVVVLNSGNNTVTKIIGGAAPVATPAAAATRDVQQGVRP